MLKTGIVENITSRKGVNLLKKRHYESLDLLTNLPIRTLTHSVTVE